MEKVKIKLTDPIEANGEEISDIELRKPLMREVKKYGLPFAIDAEGRPQMNGEVTSKFISDLAGIPPSSVDQMSIADGFACWTEIMGFLGKRPQT